MVTHHTLTVVFKVRIFTGEQNSFIAQWIEQQATNFLMWVRILLKLLTEVPQLVEGAALEPVKCQFESVLRYK